MKRITIEIPISPVPKPRMTRQDRWTDKDKEIGRPAVIRYFRFQDDLLKLITGQLDARFTVVFRIAMPQSWPEKKKEIFNEKPHQQKPDIDNYLKAFLDALCPDDSYVYDVQAKKFWARQGSIELTERGD